MGTHGPAGVGPGILKKQLQDSPYGIVSVGSLFSILVSCVVTGACGTPPALANRSAMAAPIPREAPVTMAT